ncbi:MAG TPA: thiolase domain-containing protein [Desulfobacteria bacterium]|nr:thiolase domain-containing protein [Desulfobacteria bacterium]
MAIKVGVLGTGKTKHGVHYDRSLRDLMVEAGRKAIQDSGLDPKDIDLLVVGNAASIGFNNENNISGMIGDHLGLVPKPNVRCEAACGTGGWAAHIATLGILSGLYKTALVIGGEKMSDVTTAVSTGVIAQAADAKEEYFGGHTFPAGVAMYAARYMARFGCSEADMAHVAVKNHYYGARNPDAQLRFECTVEEVLKSPYVAKPLHLFEVCPTTDAASAVVLCHEDIMKSSNKPQVYMTGTAVGSGTYYNTVDQLEDNWALVKGPVDQAYEMAGVKPGQINIAEIYNAFSVQEILGLEAAGFAPYGEGWKLVADGQTHHDGRFPINISGGVLSKGHPLGATGTSEIVDVVQQLRGDFPGVKVKDPEFGLSINRGGPGSVCVCYVYQRTV